LIILPGPGRIIFQGNVKGLIKKEQMKYFKEIIADLSADRKRRRRRVSTLPRKGAGRITSLPNFNPATCRALVVGFGAGQVLVISTIDRWSFN